MPETVNEKNKRPFKLLRANPLGALKHLSKIVGVSRLLFILFIYDIAFYVYPAIWAYWSEERFGWLPIQIGYSFAAFGFCMAITQGYLMRKITKYVGERKTVISALYLISGVMVTITADNHQGANDVIISQVQGDNWVELARR